MSRHSRKACDRAAGFSFVELLVTIVIAGIAFAAMVPMFVQAQQKNSADLLRQQVANVAQGKIERIRQLDYGSIKADAAHPGTTPNLYNPTFADGQFGPTESLSTGTGTRVINLSYNVEDYPTGASGITSQYKVVHVTATWDAPPSPVKPVTISTIVYRQYSGPPITNFSTLPVMDDTGLLGDQNLTEVLLSAHVDPSGGVPAVSVEFAVAQYGGATLASATVDTTMITPSDKLNGLWYEAATTTFYWRWTLTNEATNGVYDFQATALASDGFAGNTPHIYPRIERRDPPGAPASVTAVAGSGSVDVTWGVSTDTGVTEYRVYRSTAAAGPWTLITTTTTPVQITDSGVVIGGTYYYSVVAYRSADGRTSARTVSNAVTPGTPTDVTPPTAPTNVVASTTAGSSTVRLTWLAATDPGTPSTGVVRYDIERSSSLGGTYTAVTGSPWTNLTILRFDDATAGWSSTWYYQIYAVDGAGLRGPASTVVWATTGARPMHQLAVTNTINGASKTRYVWIQDTSGHFFSKAGADLGTTGSVVSGVAIASKGGMDTWTLPAGPYHVWAWDSNSFTSATMRLPDVDLSGGNAAKDITD